MHWVNQMCGMGCALGYIHQVEDLILAVTSPSNVAT